MFTQDLHSSFHKRITYSPIRVGRFGCSAVINRDRCEVSVVERCNDVVVVMMWLL